MKKWFSIQQVTIIVLFTWITGCLMGVVAMKLATFGQATPPPGTPLVQCPATYTATMPVPTSLVMPQASSTLPAPTFASPPPLSTATATSTPPALLPTSTEPDPLTPPPPTLPRAITPTPEPSTPITLTLTAEEVTSLAQQEAAQAGPDQVTVRDPIITITEQEMQLTGQVTNLGIFSNGDLQVVGVPFIEDGELRFQVTRATVNKIPLPKSLFPEIESVVNRVLARSLSGVDAQEVSLSQGAITLTLLPWPP